AVEFAWSHSSDYDALLFVNADSPSSLSRSLAELVGPLVLDLKDVQDVREEEKRVAGAFAWLESHHRWFLILDNVDSPEAAASAEKLLPRLARGHVVITSRIKQWGHGVERLELDVLDSSDARDFLLERTKDARKTAATDNADALTLAQTLGRQALALEQA